MRMLNLSHTGQTDSFIVDFDAAIEAHMDWTRRILRCAVLHTHPGEDVMSPVAHTLCLFGHWFTSQAEYFNELDNESVQRVDTLHQAMHDAMRNICADVMNGTPGKEADLQAFEHAQSELLTLLARLKTLCISHAVRHDPLTGLPLRHGIERDFALCMKDARRNHTLVYVILIDVDHFKRINDDYGHPAGDMVLQHLADMLRLSLRDNEPLYRFGGEEFLWLMRCVSADEAEKSASRLLATIRATPVSIASLTTPIALTVTLGLACAGENEELSSAIKRADVALYQGKKDGRNRFVIAA